ncbi:coiled-coil domain-containing protein 13 [Chironomus tepperi]|uniref:coiled-coil domain-containing protein 13 n=1 Tax=Chironomus tepperi TaxID=113505 RepID=UPI00391F34FD
MEKLSQRNLKLQEKLMKKEEEVLELQEKNDSLEQALTSLAVECSPVSAQKITDLSKTNRRLSSQLNLVKSKNLDLEDKNQKLEELLNKKDKLLEQYECSKDPEPVQQSEVQILTENLERTKKKLFEASNFNLQLKNELKIAQKCLQHEIGSDNINFSQILNSTSNWRGRAQQIQMLQSKVAELRDKLENTETDSFDANTMSLRRIESARRMEIDSLTKELDDCKNELDDLKHKVSALKIRNKNLSDEANNYKFKTLELMEKSKNDDDYVKCLNEKISMVKYEYEHKITEMEKEMTKMRQMSDDSKLEVKKLQCDLENASQLLSDKDRDISSLKSLNEDLENNLRNISGDFLFSCRNMSKSDYVNLISTLEQEKNRLLNMIEDLNKRLNKQSLLESDQHDMIAKQRVKIARLEAKLKELENEKEAIKTKHRRGIRINEYSRSVSGMNINNNRPVTKSSERLTSEIDRLKLKLEYATERIDYFEKKLQSLNIDREEDCQKFLDIMGKSKECFQRIFNETKDVTSSYADTTVETMDDAGN